MSLALTFGAGVSSLEGRAKDQIAMFGSYGPPAQSQGAPSHVNVSVMSVNLF
jgi:hypothetical protein